MTPPAQIDYPTPVLPGIGLSIDCFTVPLAIGTTTKIRLINAAVIIGVCFAVFQTGMTLSGWGVGATFVGFISADDHWIAFRLLAIIDVKQIVEGIRYEKDETPVEVVQLVPLILLSIATSIDALPGRRLVWRAPDLRAHYGARHRRCCVCRFLCGHLA